MRKAHPLAHNVHRLLRMTEQGKQIHGKLQAFNVSPKGSYEGLLIGTKNGVVQLNFPQEAASGIAESVPAGSIVDAEGEPAERKGHSAHPVFHLLSLKADGKPVFPIGNGHGSSSDDHFSGTATQLNYALHGEVNGAILDTGDFLHLKPYGAAAIKLEIGMELKGRGSRKPMLDGHHVIEAEEVNGVKLEKKKPQKKAPPA